MSVAILDRTIVTRTVPISKAITIRPRCPPSRAGAERRTVLLHERKTMGRRTNDMRPKNMNGNIVMATEPVTKAHIAQTATSKADPCRRKDDDRVVSFFRRMDPGYRSSLPERVRHEGGVERPQAACQFRTTRPEWPVIITSNPFRNSRYGKWWVMTGLMSRPLSSITFILYQVSYISRP